MAHLKEVPAGTRPTPPGNWRRFALANRPSRSSKGLVREGVLAQPGGVPKELRNRGLQVRVLPSALAPVRTYGSRTAGAVIASGASTTIARQCAGRTELPQPLHGRRALARTNRPWLWQQAIEAVLRLPEFRKARHPMSSVAR